jgi:hypothetical protein
MNKARSFPCRNAIHDEAQRLTWCHSGLGNLRAFSELTTTSSAFLICWV